MYLFGAGIPSERLFQSPAFKDRWPLSYLPLVWGSPVMYYQRKKKKKIKNYLKKKKKENDFEFLLLCSHKKMRKGASQEICKEINANTQHPC